MAAPINVYKPNYSSDDSVYTHEHGRAGDPIPSIEEIGWPAPEGFLFKEWNTARDGSGISFAPGDRSDDMAALYYAIWEKLPKPKKYIAEEASLTAVADAIRAKSGATGQLSFPTGFVNAISGISGGGPTKVIHGYSDETVTLAPEEVWFEEDFHSPTRNSFCVYLFYYIPGDSWMAMTFDPADGLSAYSCERDYTIYRARFSCTYESSELSSITMYEFSVCSGGFEDQGDDLTESIGDWYIMYFEF